MQSLVICRRLVSSVTYNYFRPSEGYLYKKDRMEYVKTEPGECDHADTESFITKQDEMKMEVTVIEPPLIIPDVKIEQQMTECIKLEPEDSGNIHTNVNEMNAMVVKAEMQPPPNVLYVMKRESQEEGTKEYPSQLLERNDKQFNQQENTADNENIMYPIHESYDIEDDKNDICVYNHAGDSMCTCSLCNDKRDPSGQKTLEKSYICHICNKSFSRKAHLTSHTYIHTGTKPFVCTVCNKSFTHKRHLVEHMRIHTGEKPYNCPDCNKPFSRKWYLTKHMYTHRGGKPYPCTQCTKSFVQKFHLVRHMKKHTGEKSLNCNICNKTFFRKYDLNSHLRIHTGRLPFSCKKCEKSFTRMAHLAEHMNVHMGEKPFTCSTCNKSFSHKSNLTVHMSIHKGQKPFTCDVCGKSFCRRSYLTGHVRIHAGPGLYKCNICYKSYSRKYRLSMHMYVHAGEKNSPS